jgi:hypothetical protein
MRGVPIMVGLLIGAGMLVAVPTPRVAALGCEIALRTDDLPSPALRTAIAEGDVLWIEGTVLVPNATVEITYSLAMAPVATEVIQTDATGSYSVPHVFVEGEVGSWWISAFSEEASCSHTAIAEVIGDVAGSPYKAESAWAWQVRITRGCAAFSFCPDGAVTREQMASFLVRALALPPTTTDFFTDDGGSVHEADINALAAARIAAGCGGTRFCPGASVTRQEMASFLARGFALPATSTDFFTDDGASIHQADINRLAASRITGGCGGSRFCPRAIVTRGQLAAFLRRGLS